MFNYLCLMRPKHYIKNFLLFLPVFFSGNFFDIDALFQLGITFVIFSLLCSCIYILNDYLDREKDRRHPTKKNRPIASGKVSEKSAIILLMILIFVISVLCIVVKINYVVLIYFIIYVLVNIFYSMWGKNKVILDVVLLASGYPLRILIGGAVVRIAISEWMFLTVTCFALYLAIGKRYGELKRISDIESRPVLKKYDIHYLRNMMNAMMILGIVFYSLWTISKDVSYVYSVPILIVVCMDYSLLIQEKDGDPIETIFASPGLLLLLIIYIVFVGCLLYIK